MTLPLYSILNVLIATGALYLVTRSSMPQIWSLITMALTAIVLFATALRIVLEFGLSDIAYYLYGVVFPFSSGALIALVIVATISIFLRALGGFRT